MTYPAITARRMPYDIDGCEVAFGYITTGIQVWMNSAEKVFLNDEQGYGINNYNTGARNRLWVFSPEVREVTHIYGYNVGYYTQQFKIIEGSVDTTNGLDGTWETAAMPDGMPLYVNDFSWRDGIKVVSFSQPIKVLRIGLTYTTSPYYINTLHLYGQKAAGQTPDDILFVDASTGAEFTALKDWGDRPEGTTVIWSFKLKNASAGKIANDINVQLNHADFTIAWASDGPWVSVLDIASIGIGALSNTIYARNQLAPPLLTLGPKQARVIATVGSWT